MKVMEAMGALLMGAVVSAMGQTNDAAFFRIASPSNAVITEFDPAAGTISWSNGVAGVTNQVQRSVDLSATNGWADYVLLVSTGAVACTERILDLDPPDGMVFIPGGSNSGTNPLGAGESYSGNYPETYLLTVSSFYMDRTEITKAQWDTVYNWAVSHGYGFDNAGSGKASNHPVQTVNWYDCVKWCNARSQMEGKTPCYTVGGSVYKSGRSAPDCNFSASGYRLPTNDEWEYAARGGLSGRRFPWGDTITHSQANYWSESSYGYDISPTRVYHPSYSTGGFPYTSPVGSFAANGYGLYDMSGNAWERCWDASGSLRSVRGGGWFDSASDLRCGSAYWNHPGTAPYYNGFRAVCR